MKLNLYRQREDRRESKFGIRTAVIVISIILLSVTWQKN